jgi:hypothetical protein
VRTAEGIAQLDRTAGTHDSSSSRTSPSDLLAMARREPRVAPRVAVFLAVALTARLLARRAVRRDDYSAWRRDESSRQ